MHKQKNRLDMIECDNTHRAGKGCFSKMFTPTTTAFSFFIPKFKNQQKLKYFCILSSMSELFKYIYLISGCFLHLPLSHRERCPTHGQSIPCMIYILDAQDIIKRVGSKVWMGVMRVAHEIPCYHYKISLQKLPPAAVMLNLLRRRLQVPPSNTSSYSWAANGEMSGT